MQQQELFAGESPMMQRAMVKALAAPYRRDGSGRNAERKRILVRAMELAEGLGDKRRANFLRQKIKALGGV